MSALNLTNEMMSLNEMLRLDSAAEAVNDAIFEQTLRSIADPTYDPDPEMTRYMQDRYGLDTRHDGLPRASGECGFMSFNVVAGSPTMSTTNNSKQWH